MALRSLSTRSSSLLATLAVATCLASTGALGQPGGGSPPMPPPGPNGALPPGLAPPQPDQPPPPQPIPQWAQPATRMQPRPGADPELTGTVQSLQPGDRVALFSPTGDKGAVVRIGGAGDPPVYRDCVAVHLDAYVAEPSALGWFCPKSGTPLYKLGPGNTAQRVQPPPPITVPDAGVPAQAELVRGDRIFARDQKGTVMRIGGAGDPPVYKGCYAVHYDYDFNNPAAVQWLCTRTMTAKIYKLGPDGQPAAEIPTGR